MAGETNKESEGPRPENGRRPGFWELQKMPSQKTRLGEAEEHKIGTEQVYRLKVGACLLSISLPYLRASCLCCPKKPSHTEVKLFFCDEWKEGLECYPICLLSTTIEINQVATSMRRVSIWQEIRCCPFPSIIVCMKFLIILIFPRCFLSSLCD